MCGGGLRYGTIQQVEKSSEVPTTNPLSEDHLRPGVLFKTGAATPGTPAWGRTTRASGPQNLGRLLITMAVSALE